MRALFIIAALLALTACGLKDDLYLPEPKTAEPANTPGKTPPTPVRSDDPTIR